MRPAHWHPPFFEAYPMNVDELTFDVSQEVEIKAAPGTVYKNMITELSQIIGR